MAARASSGEICPRPTARETDMMSCWLFTTVSVSPPVRKLSQESAKRRDFVRDVLPRAVLRDKPLELLFEPLLGAMDEVGDVGHLLAQPLRDLLVTQALE